MPALIGLRQIGKCISRKRFVKKKQVATLTRENFIGQTPLIVAASKNNFDFVQFLIKNGADVNAKSDLGKTPFMTAAIVKT
ncbi:MAG: ankyrin repeat domain-containing protein [Desulfobacterales bacterium]|nr:ankyrin repeat domain-containing protein [Desulfobacterales bacterium]